MAFLEKPSNIYHTDDNNSWMNDFENMFKKDLGEKVVEETLKQDKIQVIEEPEKTTQPTIDELSYDEKLEFVKKFAKEFNIEFTMKVTPSIPVESTPVVTPVVESIQEEVRIIPEVIKKDVVEVENEKSISFNYEKPEGWNKKRKRMSFYKVFFNGLFGVDMDPSDFRRYEKFMDNFKPVFIILLLGAVALSAHFIKIDDKNTGRKTSVIDVVFNFCVEKYDEWTGRKENYVPKNNIKVDDKVDTVINYVPQPGYFDTLKREDWEKQYEKLDSTVKTTN